MKNIFKKILSLLLAVTIIFSSAYAGLGDVDFGSVFAVKANAASTSDLTIEKDYGHGSKGCKVTDCKTSASGTLTIPSMYDGEPVTSVDGSAFSYCKSLTSITIPDSVISIGGSAFTDCTSLTSIIIPDSVTNIGGHAFYNCTSLTSVTIGNSVTSIGDRAFYYCSKLTVYYNGTEADWANIAIGSDNRSLTNAEIHFIDDILTFSLNTDGQSYSVTDCDTSVSSVVIPKTYNGKDVTKIGSSAFYGCTNLKTVTIPESVVSIGSSAFSGCTYLEKVYWNAKNVADLTSSSNVFYNAGKYSYSYGLEIVFGGLVERIPAYLCYVSSSSYRPRISKITIGNNVKSIGIAAFRYCDYLGSVIIPDTVTSVGNYAFSDSGLYLIVLGNSVTSIGSFAFNSCSSLASITIPNSVTSIGSYAFNNCSSLTDVYYGGIESAWTNTSIGSYNTCLSNAEIHFIDDIFNFALNSDGESYSVTACNTSLIYGIAIPSAYNGKPVTGIGYGVFKNCTVLKSITIPESVTSIDSSVFSGCTYLEKVYWNAKNVYDFESYGSFIFYNAGTSGSGIELVFGDSVERIPAYMCYVSGSSYKPKITKVRMGENVTSIGRDAFYECSAITEVYITDIVSWCEIGFKNNYSNPLYYALKLYIKEKVATNIIIPETATEISNYAFYKCLCIKTMKIGDGVTHIGESAFDYCNELVSVTMGKNIKSIDDWAFAECNKLESVYISDLVSWCDIEFAHRVSNPLYYANNLYVDGQLVTELVIPDGLTTIKDYTFCLWQNLTSVIIPGTVTSIGESAFDTCRGLISITIPDSITSIGNSVFSQCEGLKYVFYSGAEDKWSDITIGEYNQPLASAIFHYNATGHTSTTEWIIDSKPNCLSSGSQSHRCTICGCKTDVTVIPALGHKISIEWTIDIEPTCTEEGSKSHHCTVCDTKEDVTAIVANGHTYEWENDYETLNKIGTCTVCGSGTVVEIPGSSSLVITLDSAGTAYTITDCLSNYSGEVEIPKMYKGLPITAIGTDVFRDCTDITSVIIPDSVTSIGGSAFRGCTNLKELIISKNITSIPGAMCLGCTNLENIVIPDGVVNIGGYAFSGCTSLKTAVIPDSATNIGASVFANCKDLLIVCEENSGAKTYAVDNGISYIENPEETQFDLTAEKIYTDITGAKANKIVSGSDNISFSTDTNYAGTGIVLRIMKGGALHSQYIIVVNGDTNGDSVCDVLDCFDVERTSNGNADLSGVYGEAGDSNNDGIIDITDYQSIVNKAIA